MPHAKERVGASERSCGGRRGNYLGVLLDALYGVGEPAVPVRRQHLEHPVALLQRDLQCLLEAIPHHAQHLELALLVHGVHERAHGSGPGTHHKLAGRRRVGPAAVRGRQKALDDQREAGGGGDADVLEQAESQQRDHDLQYRLRVWQDGTAHVLAVLVYHLHGHVLVLEDARVDLDALDAGAAHVHRHRPRARLLVHLVLALRGARCLAVSHVNVRLHLRPVQQRRHHQRQVLREVRAQHLPDPRARLRHVDVVRVVGEGERGRLRSGRLRLRQQQLQHLLGVREEQLLAHGLAHHRHRLQSLAAQEAVLWRSAAGQRRLGHLQERGVEGREGLAPRDRGSLRAARHRRLTQVQVHALAARDAGEQALQQRGEVRRQRLLLAGLVVEEVSQGGGGHRTQPRHAVVRPQVGQQRGDHRRVEHVLERLGGDADGRLELGGGRRVLGRLALLARRGRLEVAVGEVERELAQAVRGGAAQPWVNRGPRGEGGQRGHEPGQRRAHLLLRALAQQCDGEHARAAPLPGPFVRQVRSHHSHGNRQEGLAAQGAGEASDGQGPDLLQLRVVLEQRAGVGLGRLARPLLVLLHLRQQVQRQRQQSLGQPLPLAHHARGVAGQREQELDGQLARLRVQRLGRRHRHHGLADRVELAAEEGGLALCHLDEVGDALPADHLVRLQAVAQRGQQRRYQRQERVERSVRLQKQQERRRRTDRRHAHGVAGVGEAGLEHTAHAVGKGGHGLTAVFRQLVHHVQRDLAVLGLGRAGERRHGLEQLAPLALGLLGREDRAGELRDGVADLAPHVRDRLALHHGKQRVFDLLVRSGVKQRPAALVRRVEQAAEQHRAQGAVRLVGGALQQPHEAAQQWQRLLSLGVLIRGLGLTADRIVERRKSYTKSFEVHCLFDCPAANIGAALLLLQRRSANRAL
jgi:hypothetical protein